MGAPPVGRHPLYRHNLWLGTSISDQETADRMLPALLECRDLAPVLFASAEPLVGPINLSRSLVYQKDYYCGICNDWSDSPAANHHCPNCGHEHEEECCPKCSFDGEMEMVCPKCGVDGGNLGLSHADCCQREIEAAHGLGIDWLIIGGESGTKARPCAIQWVRSLVDQCRAAGVPAFVKQLGSRSIDGRVTDTGEAVGPLLVRDPKGGDPAEWPEDIRVREFPQGEL